MRAITIPEHGGRDVLTYVTDFPTPVPGPGEVLVKVAATGLNHVDLVVRRGYPGISIPLPHIPGGDIAGVVDELGDGVTGVKAGTRAVVYPLVACGECPLCNEGKPNLCLNWKYFGLHLKGGYAEYVVVPAHNVIPLPDGVSFEEAAAIPVAGLTAFHALKTVGNLQPGQTFFIWGGAGGLGTMAIQIAKQLGATVLATGSMPGRLELMKSLGADVVFNRLTDDVAAGVRKVAPAGMDLIIDFVGPETFPTSFDLLKKGGQMLLCGIITGREATVSLHMTYLRHLSIKGLYLGTKEEMVELVDWVAQKKVKPILTNTLSLADAAEAQRMLEAGEVIGKLVLRV